MPSLPRPGLIAGTGFTMIARLVGHALTPATLTQRAKAYFKPTIVRGVTVAGCHVSKLARIIATIQWLAMINPLGIMDKGIIYILIGLAAFWLSVAGLILLFI